MRCITAAALTVALGFAVTLSAGETSAKKPLGTWVRTKDDTTTTFKFAADGLHFVNDSPLGKLELEADYATTKDGKVLFGRIRTVKEGTGPAKGDLFSFGYKLTGDNLTITDWKGTGGAGLGGLFFQGEYKKSAGK